MSVFEGNKRFWWISLSVLVVVSGLFVMSSLKHKNQPTQSESCWLSTENCIGKADHRVYPLKLSKRSPNYLDTVTLTLESPQAPQAKLISLGMNMGTLPIQFTQIPDTNQWQAEFTVPACMHDKMEWGVEFTTPSSKYPQLATFVAQKES